MVNVKARSEEVNGEAMVEVALEVNATGKELISESLTIIHSLMKELKSKDIVLHALCIQAIKDNIWVLTGEDEEEDKATLIAKAMSKMTDKNIIS